MIVVALRMLTFDSAMLLDRRHVTQPPATGEES
jgi:hypothetical protein